MPNPLFDSSTLAIVAYAKVLGSTGASTTCSDKMATTRLSTGTYQCLLATAITQDINRDLILVTPKVTTAIATAGIRGAVTFELSSQEKRVIVYDGTTALDSDFDVLVLRTTLP